MKLVYLLMGAILTPWIAFSQGMVFQKGTWEETKALAKAENKLIFFDANTSWCGPCKWMEKNTFTDEKVGDFYNNNFLAFKQDMEKGVGVELAKEFKIRGYPTLLFLNGDGEIVHRTMGAIDADKFLALGKIAIDPQRNLAGMENRYRNGERTKPFIREYLAVLADAGKPTKEILDWYFYNMPDEELLTQENFEVIKRHLYDLNAPQFKFLVENREAYSKIVPEKEVKDKIYNVYRSNLFSALYSNDSARWEQAKADVKASVIDKPDELLAYANTYYYSRKKDWSSYIEAVNNYATNYLNDNWQSLNSYAWQVYTNKQITDKSSLKQALKWIDRSIELNSCYANNDTKAALLYKLGNKKGALKFAKKAISLAGPDDNVSGTEELIAKITG